MLCVARTGSVAADGKVRCVLSTHTHTRSWTASPSLSPPPPPPACVGAFTSSFSIVASVLPLIPLTPARSDPTSLVSSLFLPVAHARAQVP